MEYESTEIGNDSMILSNFQYRALKSMFIAVWGEVWDNNPTQIGPKMKACDEANIPLSIQNSTLVLAQENRSSFFKYLAPQLKLTINSNKE